MTVWILSEPGLNDLFSFFGTGDQKSQAYQTTRVNTPQELFTGRFLEEPKWFFYGTAAKKKKKKLFWNLYF